MHCSGLQDVGLDNFKMTAATYCIPHYNNALFEGLIIYGWGILFTFFCWSTHQTTFFNYVIGIFILIVLSRLANLHGVMRGMFPLQVIRYLRGSGVVERLNREGEVGGGGVKGRDKSQKNVWNNKSALFAEYRIKKKQQRENLPKLARAVWTCDDINITIRKCTPRQRVSLLSIHFTDHFEGEITPAI